jgi:hypothetical protein
MSLFGVSPERLKSIIVHCPITAPCNNFCVSFTNVCTLAISENDHPLFSSSEWSREALLEKWMKDPVQCCQLAGVQPPTSALQHCTSEPSAVTLEYNNAESSGAIQQQGTAKMHVETIVRMLLNLVFHGC